MPNIDIFVKVTQTGAIKDMLPEERNIREPGYRPNRTPKPIRVDSSRVQVNEGQREVPSKPEE